MEFQYDLSKSRVNFKKHGIDFQQAQLLWQSAHVEFPAKSEYENRFALIGKIAGKIYACIYCLRGQSIRIIS